VLLERERELAVFDDALRDAREGRGRVTLVEGSPGIGKTSLLRAAAETAVASGFRCAHARASELERDFAYGCVRQLLEPVIARAPDADRERWFAGAAALARPLFAPTDATQLAPSADTRFSMLHGLYWLLSNLTDEAPVVLTVDDLQWADAESVRLLGFLAPRLDGLRLAVLASTRPGETGEPGVARLATAPETAVVRPRPLSIEGTATLCERRLGGAVTDSFSRACWEATGGNPFFLEALVRETREQKIAPDDDAAARVRRIGPAAVAQAVLLRLTDAPAATSDLVRALAVLGDGAGLAEAAGLAGLREDEAARAHDLLARLEIVAPGDTLEFAHPIVREAVYADIGARERAEGHRRAADLLSALGASAERIAAQIAAAEPAADPGRVDLLRRVAGDALARGAPAAAVAWLRRALAEPPPPGSRAEVLVELGVAEQRVAAPEALDHLAEAIDITRDPMLLTGAVRRLGNALTWSDQADRAVEALGAALETVEPRDRELALFIEADLAAHAQEASHSARAPAARRLERHRDLPGTTPGERLVLAALAFEGARACESEREAAAVIEGALAGGRLLAEQELDVPPSIYVLVVGLMYTDALDLVETVLDQMLVDAQARVSIPAVAFVLAERGVARLRRGAVAQAEADASTSLELLRAHDIPLGAALSLGVLIEALVEGDEVEEAERVLATSGFAAGIPPGMPNLLLLEARARLRLAQGRVDEALDDVTELGRRDELWGGGNPLATRWRSHAALAHLARGDHARARASALDDLDRARRWGAASGVGVALRAVGLAEGGTAGLDRLREAVLVLDRSPARLEHARALTDLGAALRRGNNRREARHALRAGLEIAESCGARALVQQARTELQAAGGRSRDPWASGPGRLTASERRVADLASEGLSNPEIAQALFVTRKTVETHLGSVYRKLGISGRGKLARALGPKVQGPP
jgi:DNA-binding CsgD family transcriptional regulator